MKTSERGLELITKFEGERLEAYLCPAGKLTIGVGHLVLPGENYRTGSKITKAHSRELLKSDVADAERAVENLVAVELNQNQFDALVSFVFNVGSRTFQKSSVLRLVNQKKFTEAGNFLLRYKFAAGRELAGLVRRRKAERELFLS